MKIEDIELVKFDENDIKHIKLLKEFTTGDSNSKFIHDIKERLIMNNDNLFGNGYIVKIEDEIVGYFYISPVVRDKVELEYSILKSYRGRGLGRKILNKVSKYLLDNYNIKDAYLTIDPSNQNSTFIAEESGFYMDEEEYAQNGYTGLITFTKENLNYVRKGKK